MFAQRLGVNPDSQSFIGTNGALLLDAVIDMYKAGQWEGKARIDHDADRRWKAQDVWIRRRQDIRLPEAANLGVCRQVAAINGDVGQFVDDIGNAVTMTTTGSDGGAGVEAT